MKELNEIFSFRKRSYRFIRLIISYFSESFRFENEILMHRLKYS